MRGWLWRKATRADAHVADAEQEYDRAERDHQWVVERRSLIESLVRDLRAAREVNHFAERLNAAYGLRR